MYKEWNIIEASFAFDYSIILNKKYLEGIGVKQFMNLISMFSSDSPYGKLEQLLATPNGNLSTSQASFKMEILRNRTEESRKQRDWSKGLFN